MRRRERLSPAVESLEDRNLQSAIPVAPAPSLAHVQQEVIFKEAVNRQENGIIAILIG